MVRARREVGDATAGADGLDRRRAAGGAAVAQLAEIIESPTLDATASGQRTGMTATGRDGCHAAGRKLAFAVKNGIWDGALKFLRERNMCHADIHEGNICIRNDADDEKLHATLVDLESAVSFHSELRSIVRKV